MNAEKPWFPVLIAGLITTGLTLFGLHMINVTDVKGEFNIMGWYANYIIPVGAIIVGLIAGSGYGLVSWFMGIKFNRYLLLGVMALQILAYFAAQYIEYQDIIRHFKGMAIFDKSGAVKLPIPGFFEYYDEAARSLYWKGKYDTSPTPLGAWGYSIRLLEVAGFVFGGAIAPIVLAKHPFCEQCQRYMNGKALTVVPADIPSKFLQKKDESAKASAATEAEKTIERLKQLAVEGRTVEFKSLIQELDSQKKESDKLDFRYHIGVVRCRNCKKGYLRLQSITGHGKYMKVEDLPDRVEMSPELVRVVAG